MKTTHSPLVIVAVMLASTCAVLLAQNPTEPAQAPPNPPCTITGTVSAGLAKLPGVAITVAPKEAGDPLLTSTGIDGAFRVHPAKPGEYDVVAELAAFTTVTKTVTLGPDCQAKVDLTTTLRSRTPSPASSPAQAAAAMTTATPASPPVATVRQRAQAGGQQFQRVAPVAGQRGQASGTAAADTGGVGAAEDAQAVAEHLSLPAGFTAESVSESVTTFGSNTQTNDAFLFGGGRGEGRGPGGDGGFGGMGGDGQTALPGMGAMGGGFAAGAFGLGGGQGGPGGGGRGGGGDGGGRGGMGGGGGRPGIGNLRNNRPSGQASYTLGGSMLNAQPYALNGQSPSQPDFLNQRYTFAIGGPAKIPGLFDLGTRSSFFVNYSGSHGSNLYDSYSIVPTVAQRAGDFSSVSTPIIDPRSGLPFAGNVIPSDRISPVAAALMQYFPLPNQSGSAQNYHRSGTTVSNGDDINLRFTRTFGTPPAARGGRGGIGGGGGGGRGAGGGRGGAMMNNVVNLNVGVHFSRSDSAQLTPFVGIQGTTHRTGWDVPVNLSFGKWGMMNTLSVQFNSSKSQTTNTFGGVSNLAGLAGIGGVSADPFDWGVPTLTIAGGISLRDVNPSESLNRTIAVNGSMMKMKGRHVMRWGGSFSSLLSENHSNSNARGNFIFTGLYANGGAGSPPADVASNFGFADFLLGIPQQASTQIGPGLESFHARTYAAYFQDDWRLTGNLTMNLGVRYEYQSPYTEADNRLVTLDVPTDFSAAASVQAGQTGPFTGAFPLSIVHPDRNNFSPRLGAAWRASQRTTVRGGYGINYASVPYMSIAQKLAGQPPFALTNTLIGTVASPLSIATALSVPPAGTTNTFGVDPNYNIGYVQIWNVDMQRDVNRTWSLGMTYTGTKGSSLDLLRAPNRGPTGLRIPNVQAFIWESSGSHSLMNALSVRLRKRLSNGFSGGVTYTLSKSMDDASSIGGGGAVVAQNDQNLAAEWGRSSFDQRHRVSGDFAIELPFGANRKWVTGEGLLDKIVGDWTLNGNVSWASGSPFTARILAAASDISRGTNGTLRADYTGQPINLANPTLQEFFNTAAFVMPAPGTFGNSARNMITGPSSTTFNMSMSKSFRYAGTRSISLRIQANNVLNMPQWGSIDTVVNSKTFGQVLSMRAMRSVQFIARVSF